MISLTRLQAIDILNRLDRADDHGKLMWVTGGVSALMQTSRFMQQLAPADEGEAMVEVDEHLYMKIVVRLHEWEVIEFGVLPKDEDDE